MKKILLSIAVLGFVGAVAVGGTGAFFSDTETSSGNTFTAGAIDLKIDNTSYYNGAVSNEHTWRLADLNDGQGPSQGQYLFFNFGDLKPGDWGEDTISVHVDSNDAWACAYVTKTSDEENGVVEPEGEDAEPGELDDELSFIWWADDGDNVLEVGEKVLNENKLGQAPVGYEHTVLLADKNENIWAVDGTPLKGGVDAQNNNQPFVYNIGKAWCYGTLTKTPVAAGEGENPTVNSGFTCDGSSVTNQSQTDKTMLDVRFYAEQARNNPDFVCGANPVNPGIPDNKTFFTEDFESFNGGTPGVQDGPSAGQYVDNANWDQQNGVRAVLVNGDDAAELDAGAPGSETLWTVLTLDTTGYGSINLMYDLLLQGIETDQVDAFTVAYSTNGGTTWNTVATYDANQPWTTHTVSLSSGADNQSNVQIRFMLVGTNVNDVATLDNVKLSGVEL